MVTLALAVLAVQTGSTIQFGGYEWEVSDSQGQARTPGPNVFSRDGVSVDENGRLHLAIRKVGDRWTCPEVRLKKSLGYGEYEVSFATALARLDAQCVASVSTWRADDRSIWLRFSAGDDPMRRLGRFYVSSTPSDSYRFSAPGMIATRFKIAWHPTVLKLYGAGSGFAAEHTLSSSMTPGSERFTLGLWLNQGKPPTDGALELVVDSFRFTPVAVGAKRPPSTTRRRGGIMFSSLGD